MSIYQLFLQARNTQLGINTQAFLKNEGATEITLNALSKIKKGDRLVLVGHGSSSKMSGLKPDELAKLLEDNGLSGPIDILLYSCNTGFGGAPYALELKMQLVQRKILCTVTAPTGPINAKGIVKKKSKDDFYGTGYTPPISKPSWVH